MLKAKEVLTILQSACKANVAENDIDSEGLLKQAGVLDSMCRADVVPEAFPKIPSLVDALTPLCSTLESEKIKQQEAFIRQMDIVVEKHGEYAKNMRWFFYCKPVQTVCIPEEWLRIYRVFQQSLGKSVKAYWQRYSLFKLPKEKHKL